SGVLSKMGASAGLRPTSMKWVWTALSPSEITEVFSKPEAERPAERVVISGPKPAAAASEIEPTPGSWSRAKTGGTPAASRMATPPQCSPSGPGCSGGAVSSTVQTLQWAWRGIGGPGGCKRQGRGGRVG